MRNILTNLIDWSEVWALLIPLTILVIRKPQYAWKKPIIIYLITALAINFTIDFLYHPFIEYKLLQSNYIFYNINSILRLVFFTWFFNYLHPRFRKLNKVVPYLYMLVVILNFIFLESLLDFSSKTMALEAAIGLIYCLIWFYLKVNDDDERWLFSYSHVWVVTGISLYSAITFFLFLFYKIIINSGDIFAYYIWDVHNISFAIMCFLIAVAFYKK